MAERVELTKGRRQKLGLWTLIITCDAPTHSDNPYLSAGTKIECHFTDSGRQFVQNAGWLNRDGRWICPQCVKLIAAA
jgi:hypothetical protein